MIKLLRVDHRLLHGQVVFSWCSELNPNCILVADDEVAQDEFRKSALKIGKPDSVKLVIKNLEDSIKAINSGVTNKYDLMIITANIKTAVELAKHVDSIDKINLGGTKSTGDKHALSKMVYVTDEEEKLLREAVQSGIEVFVQAVPDDKKVLFQ
ncbi:PTS sugar transporter subunit IIB [Enterococcus faecium]|uniref:PTS sugar transporter subunit IIB n=1 Tax=Enterococcus faecium TaxID=1352 RepID=UPI0039C5F59A